MKSDRAVFNEELNIARIADETGFDSVWTIEHHFTPYTMVTNPLQYLTYVAGITRKVDLGTMVTVLPLAQPGTGGGRREYAGRLSRAGPGDYLRGWSGFGPPRI